MCPNFNCLYIEQSLKVLKSSLGMFIGMQKSITFHGLTNKFHDFHYETKGAGVQFPCRHVDDEPNHRKSEKIHSRLEITDVQ